MTHGQEHHLDVAPWEYSRPAFSQESGIPNVASPEGEELGSHLARFCEDARAKLPEPPPMCVDCAFRRGSEPNKMAVTLMDATKCFIEGDLFFCHHGEERVCGGFQSLVEVSYLTAKGDLE